MLGQPALHLPKALRRKTSKADWVNLDSVHKSLENGRPNEKRIAEVNVMLRVARRGLITRYKTRRRIAPNIERDGIPPAHLRCTGPRTRPNNG